MLLREITVIRSGRGIEDSIMANGQRGILDAQIFADLYDG